MAKQYRIMASHVTHKGWFDFVGTGEYFDSVEDCNDYMKRISERYPEEDYEYKIKYQSREISDWRDV